MQVFLVLETLCLLLCLNQNPDIGCTPNSLILDIYLYVWQLKQRDVFKNYPDHESLHRVMEAIIPAYYQHWDFKYIIDRGPAGTVGKSLSS